LEDIMSTPLSLSTPENGALATGSATTEQVAFWSVTGIVTAAAAVGIFEVALHLVG
jgi:hypothetical protein